MLANLRNAKPEARQAVAEAIDNLRSANGLDGPLTQQSLSAHMAQIGADEDGDEKPDDEPDSDEQE